LAATELLQLGWTPALWQQAPVDLAKGHAGAWAQWPLPQVVALQQKLCHDLSCLHVGATPRYFPAATLAVLMPTALPRLAAWDAELRAAQRHAEHPWSAGLKLQALLLRAQQALRSSARSSVH
jgi:DNA polymerase-3 subunit delta'